MEQLHTRLKTLFPSVRWPTLSRSPRGDVATASPVPGPVGYLVNHPAGLAGVQGIGYDYVLGSGGLYVQSESAHLTARVTVAPGTVRGLAPVAEKLQLTHGPIPASLFELGLRWFQDAPDTERFFAVRWDGDGYRLVVPPNRKGPQRDSRISPPQGWSPSSTPTEVLAPSSRPPTTGTSRASASTASPDASTPLYPSCGSGSGSTATSPRWTGPRCSAARTRASGSWAKSRSQHKTQTQRQGGNQCPTTWTTHSCSTTRGSPWWAAAGPAASWPRAYAASSRGGRATIVLVDHDRVEPHNLLRQNFYTEDVGRFKSQALADRLARAYRRPVGYSVYPFREEDSQSRWGPLPRPSLLRELPAHRLRRQRRRSQGDGGVPAGRPAPVAHRRGQRHQLGTGAHRERGRSGLRGRTSLRRGDLLPAARTHGTAPRPPDRRVNHDLPTWTARRPSTSPTRTRPSTR